MKWFYKLIYKLFSWLHLRVKSDFLIDLTHVFYYHAGGKLGYYKIEQSKIYYIEDEKNDL